jgi:putative FmdB family regulatory protein
MPTYEYRCTKCGEHIEVYQSFSEEPLKKHAGCGGKLNKVLGSVGIVFKGSGFYRTDNRGSSRSGSRDKEKAESSNGSSDSSKSDSSKSDSTSSSSSDAKSKKSDKPSTSKAKSA